MVKSLAFGVFSACLPVKFVIFICICRSYASFGLDGCLVPGLAFPSIGDTWISDVQLLNDSFDDILLTVNNATSFSTTEQYCQEWNVGSAELGNVVDCEYRSTRSWASGGLDLTNTAITSVTAAAAAPTELTVAMTRNSHTRQAPFNISIHNPFANHSALHFKYFTIGSQNTTMLLVSDGVMDAQMFSIQFVSRADNAVRNISAVTLAGTAFAFDSSDSFDIESASSEIALFESLNLIRLPSLCAVDVFAIYEVFSGGDRMFEAENVFQVDKSFDNGGLVDDATSRIYKWQMQSNTLTVYDIQSRVQQTYSLNLLGTTLAPTREPTTQPTLEPTSEPTAEPTFQPTVDPTMELTVHPSSFASSSSSSTRYPTFSPTYNDSILSDYDIRYGVRLVYSFEYECVSSSSNKSISNILTNLTQNFLENVLDDLPFTDDNCTEFNAVNITYVHDEVNSVIVQQIVFVCDESAQQQLSERLQAPDAAVELEYDFLLVQTKDILIVNENSITLEFDIINIRERKVDGTISTTEYVSSAVQSPGPQQSQTSEDGHWVAVISGGCVAVFSCVFVIGILVARRKHKQKAVEKAIIDEDNEDNDVIEFPAGEIHLEPGAVSEDQRADAIAHDKLAMMIEDDEEVIGDEEANQTTRGNDCAVIEGASTDRGYDDDNNLMEAKTDLDLQNEAEVKQWLLHIAKVPNDICHLLIAHGFENMHIVRELDESELNQIGVHSAEHKHRILEAVAKL